MNDEVIEKIRQFIASAKRIVVIQADNPDGDSLGSSLALEHILGTAGKDVVLYCSVDMPSYLRYLDGWDRVQKDLPRQFDGSIFVDVSTVTLLEKLQTAGQLGWVSSKPSLVLDHHGKVQNQLHFASVLVNDEHASSTGELIYRLARQLNWPLTAEAGTGIMTAILADTQGLSNDLASSETYRIMASLLELGVNRVALEEKRREYSKMSPEIFRYKAQLIERTELLAGGRIAYVAVPQREITTFSPLYNPVPLIQNDMLAVQHVAVSIVCKQYDNGTVTGAIRANTNFGVADQIAEHMGGGGHPYASGFKIATGRPLNEVKSECIEFAVHLLNNLDRNNSDEILQHTYSTP